MGATMLTATLRLPLNAGRIDPFGLWEQVAGRIPSWTPTDMGVDAQWALDNYFGDTDVDVEAALDREHPGHQAAVTALRAQLTADLDHIRPFEHTVGAFDCISFPSEIALQKTCLATGGLSWGDSPTESYDPIRRLEASRITHFDADPPACIREER